MSDFCSARSSLEAPALRSLSCWGLASAFVSDVVLRDCNSSIQEAEAELLQIQSQPELYSEFGASQGCLASHLLGILDSGPLAGESDIQQLSALRSLRIN